MEQEVENVRPNILGQMFPWQKELVNLYVRQGSLPQYPLENLSSKANQKCLKGFINYFIEELSEAYDEVELIFEAANTNNPMKAQEHLRAYNEEIADAWHFFLEFLLYAEIDEYQLEVLIENYCKTNNYNFKPGVPFQNIMDIGGFINTSIQRGITFGVAFKIASEIEGAQDHQLTGGRRINQEMMEQHSLLLWAVTHWFNKVKSTLKNKAWAKTDRVVNETLFNDYLLNAIISWGIYLNFAGFTQGSIVKSYHRKALINIERINNGY